MGKGWYNSLKELINQEHKLRKPLQEKSGIIGKLMINTSWTSDIRSRILYRSRVKYCHNVHVNYWAKTIEKVFGRSQWRFTFDLWAALTRSDHPHVYVCGIFEGLQKWNGRIDGFLTSYLCYKGIKTSRESKCWREGIWHAGKMF